MSDHFTTLRSKGLKLLKFLHQRSIKLIFDKTQEKTQITYNVTAVTVNILKSRTKIPDGDFPGSVFANIHDFKNLAGIFHFLSTKTLGKFEFKCLMSSRFLRGYQPFQMSLIREISHISIFAKGKFSTDI